MSEHHHYAWGKAEPLLRGAWPTARDALLTGPFILAVLWIAFDPASGWSEVAAIATSVAIALVFVPASSYLLHFVHSAVVISPLHRVRDDLLIEIRAAAPSKPTDDSEAEKPTRLRVVPMHDSWSATLRIENAGPATNVAFEMRAIMLVDNSLVEDDSIPYRMRWRPKKTGADPFDFARPKQEERTQATLAIGEIATVEVANILPARDEHPTRVRLPWPGDAGLTLVLPDGCREVEFTIGWLASPKPDGRNLFTYLMTLGEDDDILGFAEKKTSGED